VKINPKDGFHLKLRCIRCEGSSAGKKTGVFDGVLWEDKTTLLNELPGDDPRRSIIPVFFRIPGDCHPTDDTSASEQIIWYLETRAKLPGVDYCEWFEVPVFRMAGNPPSSRVAAPTLHYQATGQSHEQPVRSRVHARDLPGGAREFVIPPLGNPGIAGLLVAGAVVFSALAWFTTGADREFVFFPILLGALGLALLLAALVTAFKSIRVTADATGLVLLSRWVFFRRTRHLSADEISEIAVAVGLTVGNNAYYDLRLFAGGVRTARGRWLTIVRSIRNKQEAEWLAQELSRSLRLDKVSPALTISR
jgi:hypothetical protein